MADFGIEPANERLGDFQIVRELGRGGMGVVYEALQVSLNRKVALKVLSATLGLTPVAVQRFRREAEAAAKLHHTNIVPVYATGNQGGTHFYAMELIEGPSLDQVIRQLRQEAASGQTKKPELLPGELETADLHADVDGGATAGGRDRAISQVGPAVMFGQISPGSDLKFFDTVARMMAEVADALDHAHSNGVIHRDIKPSNLLLSPASHLSVNDFGLARVLEQPGMTTSGEFVGTPAYMSPEQITSGRIPLDHRTDIYSLGATLYELLTLEPPHKGQTREQLLAQIVQKEPTAPRRIQKKVPADLETICLKCLEKDPDGRYQSAAKLADDLRRYVNRFAISARRAGPMQRLAKWARRRPGIAASLGGIILAAGVALAFAHRAFRAEQQRLFEQQQAEARFRDAEDRARTQLLDEKMRSTFMIASSGDLKRTDEAIKEIEALGASTGQVRLLRGVVAYFGKDMDAAINELEQAVRLLPESIAARALLAMACAENGNEERHGQLSREMRHLSPMTSEDYLFRGYARQVNEPGEGLEDMDEGIRRGDSPVGRALRAIVRANQAIDSGSLSAADAAVADADAARGMRPDNLTVLYASAYARLVAAALYQEADRPLKRREILEQAARDVQALEPYVEFGGPSWMIWQYYHDVGAPAKALAIARRSHGRWEGPAAWLWAVSLYLDGRFTEALTCFDQRESTGLIGEITRGLVLAELKDDGLQKARDICDAIARTYPNETWECKYRAELLLLLGRREQALATFRRFRPPLVESRSWEEFHDAMRQFSCGELSEARYLAQAGRSRWMLASAHYDIGIFRLADGDRSAAREHFDEAVKTYAIWLYQWTWSLMFRSRLEKDPHWPPWIAAKR
jgi:serine/threonine protein kinase